MRRKIVLGLVCCLAWLGRLVGQEPVRLTREHADLWIDHVEGRSTNALVWRVVDHDHRTSHALEEAILVVGETGRVELPWDMPPLGGAGESLWILPQSPRPDLLYLGWNMGGIASDAVAGGVTIRLVAIQGPGHFLMWQAGLEGFEVVINTRDGVDAADRVVMPAGSHSHWNFGFTASGQYELTFVASSFSAREGIMISSAPAVVRFEVHPLPAPHRPYVQWQRREWPGVENDAVIGPGADPDGDGIVNVVEYALGLNPHVADRDRLPWPILVEVEGRTVLRISLLRNPAATDARFHVWWSPAVGPGAQWIPMERSGPEGGAGEPDALVFDLDIESQTGFLRWGVELIE